MVSTPKNQLRAVRIAILGTRGIPARYGGFETFADEISRRLAQRGVAVTVFCEAENGVQQKEYLGVDLVYIPAPRLGPLSTIAYDLRCLWRARKGYDVVYMLGYGASIFCFLPRLWGTEVWINMDGLEWKRRKWSPIARAYLHLMERIATWMPNRIIADSRAIRSDVRRRYAACIPCDVIPYGCEVLENSPEVAPLTQWGLDAGEYYLVVCRFEPENHVLEIMKGFLASGSQRALVLVGDNRVATSYVQELVKYQDQRVRFIGPIYDKRNLLSLRFHSKAYLHGHSVGGTNPSLLEAMGCSNLIVAHDNPFNGEVLQDAGLFFKDAQELSRIIADIDLGLSEGKALRESAKSRALRYYGWPLITSAYENLLSLRGMEHQEMDIAPQISARGTSSPENVS